MDIAELKVGQEVTDSINIKYGMRGGLFIESVDLSKNQVTFTNGVTYDDDSKVYILEGAIVEKNIQVYTLSEALEA